MEILCKPLQFFTLQMKIKQQPSLLPGFPQHISSFGGLACSLYQPRCPGMRQQCEDGVDTPKPFHPLQEGCLKPHFLVYLPGSCLIWQPDRGEAAAALSSQVQLLVRLSTYFKQAHTCVQHIYMYILGRPQRQRSSAPMQTQTAPMAWTHPSPAHQDGGLLVGKRETEREGDMYNVEPLAAGLRHAVHTVASTGSLPCCLTCVHTQACLLINPWAPTVSPAVGQDPLVPVWPDPPMVSPPATQTHTGLPGHPTYLLAGLA